MYFALTDEQRALQETVRDFLADRFPLEKVREGYEDADSNGDPEALWRAVGEQGWLAVTVPEEHDGLGLGLLDAVVIAKRWGHGVVPGPYLATLIAGEALRLAAGKEQAAEWLPKLAAGELKLALALRRAGGGWDLDGIGVTASGGRLTGTAAGVDYAHVADRLVVAATGGELYLVDPAADGVTITAHEVMDRTSRLCTVELDSVAGERLEGSSPGVFTEVLQRAAVVTAADLAGVARESLTRTVSYDRERVQFGKPVGSFQALKHALADLHVGVTMAEHGVLYAAYAIDEGREDAELMVHVAKAKASDSARDVTAAMVQFHGGIGYTWEHDAHFFFKRAKRQEYAYGDGAFHRERIARIAIDNAGGAAAAAV